MTSFLHAYFTRLNCQPLTVPTVETLGTLHLAHNCAIPFENLDVLLPREIQLDETALEEKLLHARRGDTVLNRMACLNARYAKSVLTSEAY